MSFKEEKLGQLIINYEMQPRMQLLLCQREAEFVFQATYKGYYP